MAYTSLSAFSDEELITFAAMKDNRTELEMELGHRLSLAVDLIDELEEELGDIETEVAEAEAEQERLEQDVGNGTDA